MLLGTLRNLLQTNGKLFFNMRIKDWTLGSILYINILVSIQSIKKIKKQQRDPTMDRMKGQEIDLKFKYF